MIGSILINNYTVSFLGPSKFMNNERCTVISTNPSVISGKKDSSGNSIPAKMCYISINNDIEFNKLKNLALSVTNRTFDNFKYPAIVTGFIFNDREFGAKWTFK